MLVIVSSDYSHKVNTISFFLLWWFSVLICVYSNRHFSCWIMIFCVSLTLSTISDVLLLISVFPPLLSSSHNGGIEAYGKSPTGFPSNFDIFSKFWKRCTLETIKGDVVTGMWLVSFLVRYFSIVHLVSYEKKLGNQQTSCWLLVYSYMYHFINSKG